MSSKMSILPVLLAAAVFTAAAGAAEKQPAPKKAGKEVLPKYGVKTPGVLIPLSSLKSEADITLESPATAVAFTDVALITNSTGIHRIDAKTNKPAEQLPLIAIDKACSGLVNAFSFLWTSSCAKPALNKIEIKTPARPGMGDRMGDRKGGPPARKTAEKTPEKTEAKAEAKTEAPAPERPRTPPPPPTASVVAQIEIGQPTASPAIAASEDSIWLLSDSKTSLQRLDPKENTIVGETRLPAGCTSILFAETALWVTCPNEPKLLRIDPKTGLVEKRIDVPAEPYALAAGESSLWVLTRKEGKVVRIDPKTNKVTATIDLAIPNSTGSIAFGEGSLWVSLPGYPLQRISPTAEKEKVLQQFTGEGGGKISFGLGSVWVTSPTSNIVYRYDPKRVAATLGE
jgi:virginiamycin B lyase